jgi:hypothetical protein
MYRGYNLDLDWNADLDGKHFEDGLALFEADKRIVQETLDTFTLHNGKLDGTKMKENWFPQMENYDVFISHSHSDRVRAIAFAGWLHKTFQIRAFVDSCLWGYADDLLKLIDDKYCYQKETKTYNYTLRNYSTSHVHMMLSTALTMMIDNAECLFFLNTPNSITVSGVVNKTDSPWIYSEIAATRMLRKNIPLRRSTVLLSKGGEINENLGVQYDVNLSHLVDINVDTISNLLGKNLKGKSTLDELYRLTPIHDDIIG